ncbi:hypothetical protein V6N13_028085 [Hibiscus sabdariffa]
MENLISLVNKIQRACTALGDHGEESALPTLWDSLPAIAVVGGQSSGKSSVLESVVGKDFLPRGAGIVTRRPLVLQLHRINEGKEYAEFMHLPKRRFTDFAAVRQEISDETDRETGRTKQISSVPIHLSIYSPNVVNLTLIDLPGLTKVAIEGQSETIVQDIENMVRSFIEKPNCIILAISPANQDLATSDAIKIAREVDPKGETNQMDAGANICVFDNGISTTEHVSVNPLAAANQFSGDDTSAMIAAQAEVTDNSWYADTGTMSHIAPEISNLASSSHRSSTSREKLYETVSFSFALPLLPVNCNYWFCGIASMNSRDRTFGVLTKIDLMDQGTDAVDILEGKAYKLQYPWVGVVNRSQADINKSVDMIAARRREREYFQSSPEYSHLAHRMGSEHLGKVLSKHLETVIKSRIPGLQSLISKTIIELEGELNHLGKPIATDAGGKLYTTMEICRAFDQNFKEHLDGVRAGGEKIYGVFDNQLPAALKRLHFDKHLSIENIRKLITEADGYQPHLIAPEQGYRRLIEYCLVSIRGPAEAAVDGVHAILKGIVQKALSETPELKQYPTLRVEVGNAAIESLERMREESKRATLQLVDMECGYLTVEFFRKLPQDSEKGGNPTYSLFDRYNEAYLRRVGSNVLQYVNMTCANLRNSIPKSIVYCQVREAKRSLLDYFFTELGKKEARQLGKLLDEDPAVVQRRANLAKRLELYRSAQHEVDAVAWSK